MKKKLKTGSKTVDLSDLDSMQFSDMSFFDKWVPENCELTHVGFYHDYGYYDEPDKAEILIEWKEKE